MWFGGFAQSSHCLRTLGVLRHLQLQSTFEGCPRSVVLRFFCLGPVGFRSRCGAACSRGSTGSSDNSAQRLAHHFAPLSAHLQFSQRSVHPKHGFVDRSQTFCGHGQIERDMGPLTFFASFLIYVNLLHIRFLSPFSFSC